MLYKFLKLTIIYFIVFISFGFVPDDNENVIIEARNHKYILSIPNSWVVDYMSGFNQAIDAFFYPKGETMQSANSLIYLRTINSQDDDYKSINALLDSDYLYYKSNCKDLMVSKEDTFSINLNIIGIVRRYSSKSKNLYQAIVYISTNNKILKIIFISKTEKGFFSTIDMFINITKSYSYVSEDGSIDRFDLIESE